MWDTQISLEMRMDDVVVVISSDAGLDLFEHGAFVQPGEAHHKAGGHLREMGYNQCERYGTPRYLWYQCPAYRDGLCSGSQVHWIWGEKIAFSCRQEIATSSPHIHRAWEPYFSPPLYKQTDIRKNHVTLNQRTDISSFFVEFWNCPTFSVPYASYWV